jgi:hypothetical protein
MVNWFTKKNKDGSVSHINTKKLRRVSDDYDLDKIASSLDIDSITSSNDIPYDNLPKFRDGNYRPDESDPVEDLTGEEKRMVEDYVGSPVILVHDDKINKPSLIFDNSEEWVAYKSEEEVNRDIKKKLEKLLRDYPESFDQDWLNKFRTISMNEEDRIEKSKEEAHRLTKYAGKHELMSLAKSFGLNLNNYKFDNESQLRKIVYDVIQKELKHQLQDPVLYYVDMEGKYTESELANMSWVNTKINYADAINDAIENNGRSHFLSTVDGREVHVGDMLLYKIRENIL